MTKNDDNLTKNHKIEDKEENSTLEEALKRQEISKAIQEGKLDPKVYRGEKNYATYIH
jgi:hypothetical protein